MTKEINQDLIVRLKGLGYTAIHLANDSNCYVPVIDTCFSIVEHISIMPLSEEEFIPISLLLNDWDSFELDGKLIQIPQPQLSNQSMAADNL